MTLLSSSEAVCPLSEVIGSLQDKVQDWMMEIKYVCFPHSLRRSSLFA